MYVCMYVCMYIYIHIYIYRKSVYLFVYARMHACMCVCMYVYIYIYIIYTVYTHSLSAPNPEALLQSLSKHLVCPPGQPAEVDCLGPGVIRCITVSRLGLRASGLRFGV